MRCRHPRQHRDAVRISAPVDRGTRSSDRGFYCDTRAVTCAEGAILRESSKAYLKIVLKARSRIKAARHFGNVCSGRLRLRGPIEYARQRPHAEHRTYGSRNLPGLLAPVQSAPSLCGRCISRQRGLKSRRSPVAVAAMCRSGLAREHPAATTYFPSRRCRSRSSAARRTTACVPLLQPGVATFARSADRPVPRRPSACFRRSFSPNSPVSVLKQRETDAFVHRLRHCSSARTLFWGATSA